MSCRKSASCAHVSAVLHALVTLTTASPQVHDEEPSIPESQNEDAVVPIISYHVPVESPKTEEGE